MPQTFHKSANALVRTSAALVGIAVAGMAAGLPALFRSAAFTEIEVAREQPVPFSHKHHVGGLGLDCRFCHTTVETTNFAGVPPTKTCIGCHSQIWGDSPMLEPVRASFRDDKSLQWSRVHKVADFVFFDHSIHVAKGIGCSSCHGRVDQMPLIRRVNTLQMEWCLDCHRQPEKYIRPKDKVFDMTWEPGPQQLAEGRALVQKYGVKSYTDCSNCHR